jgi:hypothetical protein
MRHFREPRRATVVNLTTRRRIVRIPTFHPTYQTDSTGPFRRRRTKGTAIFGLFRRHRTSPTDCSHLIISRSWARSPPAPLVQAASLHVDCHGRS